MDKAVLRLISEVIDSFEKLEIVMHLHRHGYAPATPEEIARALSLSPDEVAACMAALNEDGVLQANGPHTAAVEALARMYDEDRIEVFNLMTKTALERVRSNAARLFADAFVLRPKKKGDPDA